MKYNLFFSFVLLCTLIPLFTYAQEFVGLVGIPGLENPTADGGLNVYINALYRLSISIAALLAVIKIVAAGAKYMLSDIITHKEDAKKDIQGALIGLLIVIGAIVILNTVNSDLTKLNLNIATTTIQQGPTIDQFIALQQRNIEAIEARALADQARTAVINCPMYTFIEGGDRTRCRQECNGMRGNFNAHWLRDTCTVSEADAVSCIPTSDSMCCEGTHGGEWDEETRSCSGVTEARASSKLACGREGRVWDEARNYCRTASCNVNTDTNCCTSRGGVIQGGICTITTDQGNVNQDRQLCQAQGNIYTEPNGPCTPRTGRVVVPGTAFPVPPFASNYNPNIPSDLNQINTACQGGGPGYEYSRELNQCVIYQ